ncbi:MAG: PAS domain S-box protein [Pseudomonadota bacterium]
MEDRNKTGDELIPDPGPEGRSPHREERSAMDRHGPAENSRVKGLPDEQAHGRDPDGESAPRLLSSRESASETIDLSRLLSKELTDSGSFNISGDIWATTFGKLMQAMPIPALLLDETAGIFQANDACGRLVRNHRELIGSSFVDLIMDPSTREQASSLVESVFSDRKARSCEIWINPQSRHRWTRITFRPIRIMGERYVLALLEDLTAEKEQLILNKKHERALEMEIARRKQTEKLLKESEEKHRIVVDNAAETIVVIQQGRIVFANSEAVRRSGYPAAEIPGRPLADFVHPLDRRVVVERYERRLRGEEVPYAYPVRVLHKGGEVWWGYFNMVRITWEGTPAVLALGTDITELKQAEELLKESEEKFRALSEATFEAIILTDNGVCIGLNLSAEAMLGYTAQEAVGKSGTEFITPEFRETVRHHMLSGCEEPYEAVALRKDGSTFPCEIQGKMLNYRGSRIRVAALRDITERKQAEKALHDSEESYRRLFNGSRDGVYITTLDGSLVEANQSLLDLFGYTRDEMHSINVLDSYCDPEARKRFQEQIRIEGSVKDYEIRLLRKDGTEADCLITTSLRRSDKGTIDGYHGILRDVTEQKRLQNRLAQGQKMEAIGTLAGGIAHDFNNILYAIMGFAELALDNIPEEDNTREYLKRIWAAGERARFLVNQILTFSRQTEQEKKPILIAPIVKEVCKFIRASLPATIAIYQDIGPGLGSILGDPTQIHQVLMNLCTNAGHAMKKTGGELFVGLHEMDLESVATNEYPGLPAGTYQRLVVRDTGTGIDPNVRERIFDPYFSTKEKGEGTGLGLAVVHGIVQAHKGIIKVESEPAKGTEFQVYLPVVEKRPVPEKQAGTVPRAGDERILLVDDEEIIVELVRAVLERLGYAVTTTRSSLDALELFRADPAGFDLVVTDMTMPNMTGKDLAKEMLAIRGDIPIILCTGFTELITDEQAKSIGIRELIMKPIAKHDLARTIRRVLDA